MGAVLGTLGDLGYGFAYRVLDSQFFGVPQRRRRVFIVGRAGADPRGPAQVLLEREGERRDSRTRSQAGSVVAAGAASSPGGGGLSPVVLRMRSGKPGGGKGALLREDQSLTVATGNDQVLFQPLAFVRTHTRNHMEDGDAWKESDKSLTLAAQSNFGVHASTLVVNHPFVEHDGALYAVRKLTPLECERLQGLPDGWTEGQADTPRYRQIGNAAAVPVVEWIARGIVVEHWNGHLCTPLGIQEVSPELFVHHRAKVPADRQHFLTPFTPAQIRADKARPFLFRSIRSGAAGVLLKADGEIANLFNAGLPSGWGEALLREVVALGGNRVEYFDEPHLAALYRRHGFIEKERYPFDIELIRQDFPDFDPEKYGTPDYVIARR